MSYYTLNEQACWKQVDANGKGSLDYGEFLAVSLHLQRMANDEHLRKAFSYFDKDGNSFIEPDELRESLMEDGADDCSDIANEIFQEVDKDKVKRLGNYSTAYGQLLILNICSNMIFCHCRTGELAMKNSLQ